MDAIKTENLTKYYGKSRGIIDLNLSVQKGEWFGFIGPNGAGKSTTIRTLLGLIAPTAGSAQILGMDIVKEKKKILAETGYLPSEAVFYPGMKVKEILKLSADLRKKNCLGEAESLCDRLQLDMERKVDELSFGNRKKVAIVAALQHLPQVLILDEPTSGLDPLMQREFFEIIRERNAQGTTVFMSSHVLSEIQRNCTRAAIIREGQIIACDRVEALARTNAKRVTIHGTFDMSKMVSQSSEPGNVDKKMDTAKERAVHLEEIRDLKCTGDITSFLYSGDIRQLLGVLAKSSITDISIAEPDLEEIFLHYYEDKNGIEHNKMDDSEKRGQKIRIGKKGGGRA